MAFFGVLETVKRDWDDVLTIRPDYFAWYRRIVTTDRNRGDVFEEVVAKLGQYAESIGTGEEFRSAMAEPVADSDGVSRLVRKLAKALRLDPHITLSGASGGVNTVETAAANVDRMLGCDYPRLIDQPERRAKMWRAAWLRAHGLPSRFSFPLGRGRADSAV